jgi:hypothetical protein
MIGNISSSDSFIKEKLEELKRELVKVLGWMEDKSYQISLPLLL